LFSKLNKTYSKWEMYGCNSVKDGYHIGLPNLTPNSFMFRRNISELLIIKNEKTIFTSSAFCGCFHHSNVSVGDGWMLWIGRWWYMQDRGRVRPGRKKPLCAWCASDNITQCLVISTDLFGILHTIPMITMVKSNIKATILTFIVRISCDKRVWVCL
jgi:hypothetical protein